MRHNGNRNNHRNADFHQKEKCENSSECRTFLGVVHVSRQLLQAFLNSQAVKDALNQSKSPLAAITVLKKICVHPNLLSERAVDAVAKGGTNLCMCKLLECMCFFKIV